MLIAAWAVEAETAFIYMRDEYPACWKSCADEMQSAGKRRHRRAGSTSTCGAALGPISAAKKSAMIEASRANAACPATAHRSWRKSASSAGQHWSTTSKRCTGSPRCREGPEVLDRLRRTGAKACGLFRFWPRQGTGRQAAACGIDNLDLIDAAGGMLDGHTFKAYQPGGPSAVCCRPAWTTAPGLRHAATARLFIGSAAVVVLSDNDSAQGAALNHAAVLRGRKLRPVHAVPGRLRKSGQVDGSGEVGSRPARRAVQAMGDASICGLGQAAPNPIRLTMKHFPDEV